MEVTAQLKEKVVAALFLDMEERKSTSQAEYARYIKALLSIPFDKAALSSIKKPEKRNMLKDSTWMRLAKHFNLMGDNSWQTAATKVYETMQTYLETSKKYGMWRILCDHASFGKTYSAQQFARRNKESVFYIDCSEHSTKGEFITALARRFGMERTGTFNQLWQDVTDELLLIDNAQLICDEFGDVHDSIITLLKSLYNKADRGDRVSLSVFHIGADNLKKKMIDGRRRQKQSYAEYWSRFGEDILTLNFKEKPDLLTEELRRDAEKIIDLNLPESLASYRAEIVEKAVARRDLRIIRDQINIKRDLSTL
jgi:hypothetical protein